MRSKCRRSSLVFVLWLAAALAAAAPALAQGGHGSDAGSWTVRGFAARIQPTDADRDFGPPIDILSPSEPTGGGLRLDDGSAWGLGVEYRVTRRLGVEAQAILGDVEGEVRLDFVDPVPVTETDSRDVGTDVYTLGVDFHFTPGRRVDLYAGLLGALVRYDDLRFEARGIVFQRDGVDDTAIGVVLGADLFLDRERHWALAAAARQLSSTGDANDELGVDVDPRIVSLGVAYRFGGT